ncbi:uncharacterized protein LOC111696453 [Eurytemora carolleeae]|uniref:uncharacterized protein LOC111696453 n=1 Tax=Eurytemora carolleeae TaxID=1294199 RepID=UPI000C76743A|nr:uncharacterized protein LOC111696453 [Eurytemora carolleeae]|eukprot:XP_023321860.1 uncharacterized protein LOC111696453 [Eurytemora affinis]
MLVFQASIHICIFQIWIRLLKMKLKNIGRVTVLLLVQLSLCRGLNVIPEDGYEELRNLLNRLESRTRTLEARVEYLEQELNSLDQITREQNSSVKITRTDTPVVEISRLERLEQRFEIMEEILAQPDGKQDVKYDELQKGTRTGKQFLFSFFPASSSTASSSTSCSCTSEIQQLNDVINFVSARSKPVQGGVAGGYEIFDEAQFQYSEIFANITNLYSKVQANRADIDTKCSKKKCDMILNKAKKVNQMVKFLSTMNITYLETVVNMLSTSTATATLTNLDACLKDPTSATCTAAYG